MQRCNPMGPEIKTSNYLVYKRAEAKITLGNKTMTISGRSSVFSEPKYEVMVEDRLTDEKGIKAEGTYLQTVGMLRRYIKSWGAISGPLEMVAEALSDEERYIKKAFQIPELLCLARLDTAREADALGKLTRLDGKRLGEALDSLQNKGLIIIDVTRVSLTPLGEGIRKHIADDPGIIRMLSLIDAKNQEEKVK